MHEDSIEDPIGTDSYDKNPYYDDLNLHLSHGKFFKSLYWARREDLRYIITASIDHFL